MENKIVIYKDMTPRAPLPFRLAEIFPSIDGGYRTRMTHKCFLTYEEAHEWAFSFEKGEADGN